MIKKADKGLCIVEGEVVGGRDYLKEAGNRLLDEFVYQKVESKVETSNPVDVNNKMFRDLFYGRIILESGLQYFTYEFKKASNLGKIYFLPKTHKGFRSCDCGCGRVISKHSP